MLKLRHTSILKPSQGSDRPLGYRVLSDKDAWGGDRLCDPYPQESDDPHDGHNFQGEAQRLGLHGNWTDFWLTLCEI